MSKGALGLGFSPQPLARALPLPPFALRTQALGGVPAPTGAGGGRLGLPVRKGSGECTPLHSPLGKRNRPLPLASPAQMGGAQFSIAWAVPSSRSLGPRPVRGAFVPHPDTLVGSVYFKLGKLQMTKWVPRYFTLELNI